jgi:hypothetical protein
LFVDQAFGIFGIDALPTRLEFPGRNLDDFLELTENQRIDIAGVEGFDLLSVLVRIPEDDLAQVVL